VFSSASRRTVSNFRKNHLKERKFRQEIGRDVLLVCFLSRTEINRALLSKKLNKKGVW